MLRKFLNPLYSSGVINAIGLDTTSLLSSLNTNFGKCANWTYWGNKIFSTCKLWDSIAHFYAPSNSDDAHILFSYISSYVIGTSNFTVESWVWRDSIAGASEPTIISKEHQNPMSGEIGGFRLYLNSSGNVKFTIGDAQSIPNPPGHQATITTTSTIPFRTWKHIVAIRNGNNPNNWSIYINNSAATVTVTGPTLPSGNIEQGSNDAISIGAGIISGNNNAWHGRLNRVRMYKSALSVPNISSAYNSGCGTPTAVTTSDLDAILNSARLVEQAHSQVGSIITGGTTGAVSFFTHWRDSLCTELDSTTLWCTSVIAHLAKSTPRYGFNGMERTDEIYDQGNEYTTDFREYDPRIGRWFSIDPKNGKYPNLSPYVAFNNNPIFFTDPYGDDPVGALNTFKSPDGQDVNLVRSAATVTMSEDCGNFKKGDLQSFSIGKLTFESKFNPEGKFLGYFDKDGSKYNNPEISISGGFSNLSGRRLLDMNITFNVKNVPADGLQIIQLVRSTKYSDLTQRAFGPHSGDAVLLGLNKDAIIKFKNGFIEGQYTFKQNGEVFSGEVDGGKNSFYYFQNGKKPAYPGKPYYLDKEDLKRSFWNGTEGFINVRDKATAVDNHKTVMFTTILIATNYMHTGKNVILATYRWGYNDYGKIPTHDANPNIQGVYPKKIEFNVLNFYYPQFKLK